MCKLLSVVSALLCATTGGVVKAQDGGVSSHWLQLDQRQQAYQLGVAQDQYRWRYGQGLGERGGQRLKRDFARQRADQRQLFNRQERDRMVRTPRPLAPRLPTGGSPTVARQRTLQQQLHRQEQQQLRLHQDIQRRGWRSLR